MLKNHHEDNGRVTFPHCEFPLLDTDQLSRFLDERISQARATSVIRLGDGEGMLLSRPTPDEPVLWDSVIEHFGPQITVEETDTLADLLTSAIESADVVGIRNDIINVEFDAKNFTLDPTEFSSRFHASFHLRNSEQNIAYDEGGLRIAHLHRFLSKQPFALATKFSSAWSHFHLSHSRKLIDIINTQHSIGVIFSKDELAKQIENLLGTQVTFYAVPEVYSVAEQHGSGEIHFPHVFEKVMRNFEVDYPGQIFLVGAGICGKIYCERIRELGGIALDIGSVCDAWIDIPSRPTVYKELYQHHDFSVPSELLLRHQIA